MTTFLDSNIWIYALNQSQDIRKHQIANHLATQTGLYLSTQVINEVSVNLIKKGNFSENQIQNLIQGFYQIHHIIELDLNMLLTASTLRTKYLFSFWDSLIIASALSVNVNQLYSEDMQHGFTVEGLQIINPFL
ncbi:MAG: PIN domain-containing protein [Dolichospermum sp.]